MDNFKIVGIEGAGSDNNLGKVLYNNDKHMDVTQFKKIYETENRFEQINQTHIFIKGQPVWLHPGTNGMKYSTQIPCGKILEINTNDKGEFVYKVKVDLVNINNNKPYTQILHGVPKKYIRDKMPINGALPNKYIRNLSISSKRKTKRAGKTKRSKRKTKRSKRKTKRSKLF